MARSGSSAPPRPGSSSAKPQPPKRNLPSLQRQAEIRAFIEQYAVDRDAIRAAIHIGVDPAQAAEYAKSILTSQYGIYALRHLLDTCARRTLVTPDRVVAALWAEATNPLWFAHGSRVQALKQLSKILGIDREKQDPTKNANRVMIVPDTLPADKWEAHVMEQQRLLKEASQEPVYELEPV